MEAALKEGEMSAETFTFKSFVKVLFVYKIINLYLMKTIVFDCAVKRL